MELLKRMAADLGQEQTARLLGCTQGFLSHVLLGKKRFAAETALVIEHRRKEEWPKEYRRKYPVTRADVRPDIFGKAAA